MMSLRVPDHSFCILGHSVVIEFIFRVKRAWAALCVEEFMTPSWLGTSGGGGSVGAGGAAGTGSAVSGVSGGPLLTTPAVGVVVGTGEGTAAIDLELGATTWFFSSFEDFGGLMTSPRSCLAHGSFMAICNTLNAFITSFIISGWTNWDAEGPNLIVDQNKTKYHEIVSPILTYKWFGVYRLNITEKQVDSPPWKPSNSDWVSSTCCFGSRIEACRDKFCAPSSSVVQDLGESNDSTWGNSRSNSWRGPDMEMPIYKYIQYIYISFKLCHVSNYDIFINIFTLFFHWGNLNKYIYFNQPYNSRPNVKA